MSHRHVLVLAGGRGERFWPWSRPERPKQLLPLARDGRTLLASTMSRATTLAPAERCVVLTSLELMDKVGAECPPGTRVFGEPVGRNTAPAIAAAAILFQREAKNASFAVLSADHAIEDRTAFTRDLERALGAAERERVLVTLGVPPQRPETRLGYLQRGAAVGERVFRVARFVEKPSLEHARGFVAQGDFLWNAGIFAWQAGVLLQALQATRPALAAALAPLADARDFQAGLNQVLPACESISIDYAVLEQAPNVVMVEASFDWDDLGSWSAWARQQQKDDRGNVLFGDAVAVDCDRCVVVGEGGTAAALGLRDMVVVHAAGATLSCPLECSEDVRRVSESVRARRVM
jgi:mannose-1-phosphate guanylyltransferase